jgi:ketosteroid isomerase-like protein
VACPAGIVELFGVSLATIKRWLKRLFAAHERDDSQPLFDHVADDIHWTITGKHPLSGEYGGKHEFLEATFERGDARASLCTLQRFA